MPSFAPYPIADLETGIYLAREPWLSPETSFRDLRNCYVRNGRLWVRRGRRELGPLLDGNPCIGIFEFFDLDGNNYLVGVSTRRFYRWNETSDLWEEETAGDTFTATADDRVWFCPFQSILLFTNNVDAPYKFDPSAAPGSTVVPLATDFTGGAASIDRCRILLNDKDRILYCNTVEDTGAGANPFPQRIRRSSVGNPEAFDSASDFSDAPTARFLIAGGLVGGELVFGFTGGETWKHTYLGDPRAPYGWQRLSQVRGAESTGSFLALDEGAAFVSGRSVNFTDGVVVRKLNEALPDFHQNFDPSLIESIVGTRFDDLDHLLWAYAQTDSTEPDRILVMNHRNGSWSVFTLDALSFGLYSQTTGLVWDDLGTTPLDDYTFAPDDLKFAAGFPRLLIGDGDGMVWEYDFGEHDDVAAGETVGTVPIPMTALTQKLNPFKTQRAHLGFVDVYCDRRESKKLRLRAYRDESSAPYLDVERLMDLDGASGNKVVLRWNVNQIATFHTLELSSSNLGGAAIDAIVPWFKPAGAIREMR